MLPSRVLLDIICRLFLNCHWVDVLYKMAKGFVYENILDIALQIWVEY